ncbi:hypothetical protein OSTOST_12049 [Ostertagia ostertagi]
MPLDIDDIFITGVLTEAANVSIDGSEAIKVFKRNPEVPEFKEQFFLTDKQYTSYWFHVINYKLLTADVGSSHSPSGSAKSMQMLGGLTAQEHPFFATTRQY